MKIHKIKEKQIKSGIGKEKEKKIVIDRVY